MVKLKGLRLTFLVIMVAMCACALAAPASAQPTPSTPFMIYGYVYYESGTECNNPTVNITNLNTNEQWQATTNTSSNYYQLIRANGTDLNVSEILRFEVTSPDGSQSKVFNHTVTSTEINQGGLFNFSFALMPAVSADAAHVANHVVISEIYPDPKIGGDKCEFIELYNPTDNDVNLANWKLDDDEGNSCTLIGTIQSHGFFLIGRSTYDNKKDNTSWPNADLLSSDFPEFSGNNGDEVRLNDSGGEVIDKLGYGNGADDYESCATSIPGEGESLERKAIASSDSTKMTSGGTHHFWGNGEDTDDNSADFIKKTIPEPQNSSSALEDCPAQSWFLSNVSGSYKMYKGDMSKPGGTVTISDGGSEIWKANEAATVNVGFPAGTWDGKITLETAFAAGDTFTVKVGSKSSSDFIAYGTQMISGDGSTTSYSLAISASAFTVNANDYLALQISPSGSALEVKTGGGNSYVISPETDPGYPVPELPTIILFSTGLLALAGYVWLTKRRR